MSCAYRDFGASIDQAITPIRWSYIMNSSDFAPAYIADGVWRPTLTGDYAADCAHGRAVADDVLERMRRDDNVLHISTLARAIVEGGNWGAVEIGVFSRLSIELAR